MLELSKYVAVSFRKITLVVVKSRPRSQGHVNCSVLAQKDLLLAESIPIGSSKLRLSEEATVF